LLSLRYPLVLAAFLQSLCVLAAFRRHGGVIAATAAVATTALGVPLFLNASPYWYALLFAVAAPCWLTVVAPGARWRVEVAGFLAGMAGLFQQLPGATTAAGVLVFLLVEHASTNAERPRVARATIAIVMAIVVAYLWSVADVTALLLIGIWPVALLAWALRRVTIGDRATLRLFVRLTCGLAAAALPLAIYHLAHGSLGAFFEDAIVRARGFTRLTFIAPMHLGTWTAAGARLLTSFASAADVATGFYWVVLTLLAALNGATLLAAARRGALGALPVVAAFYGLVTLRYQIPIYLYYTASLSLLGVLWTASTHSLRAGIAVAAMAAAVAVVGVRYHAASLMRTFEGILHGEPMIAASPDALPRLGLRIDRREVPNYQPLLETIQRASRPGDPIFVFPYSPEVYFLAERPNPFRFSLLPVHLTDARSLDDLIADLDARRPPLVIHRAVDKYNQPNVTPVVDAVRARYVLLQRVGPFEVYRLR
jgi:hypothetical protein